MPDMARTLCVVRKTASELELGVSPPALPDTGFDKPLRRGPPNTVTATTMIEDNRRFVGPDNSLPVFKVPVLMTKTEL